MWCCCRLLAPYLLLTQAGRKGCLLPDRWNFFAWRKEGKWITNPFKDELVNFIQVWIKEVNPQSRPEQLIPQLISINFRTTWWKYRHNRSVVSFHRILFPLENSAAGVRLYIISRVLPAGGFVFVLEGIWSRRQAAACKGRLAFLRNRGDEMEALSRDANRHACWAAGYFAGGWSIERNSCIKVPSRNSIIKSSGGSIDVIAKTVFFSFKGYQPYIHIEFIAALLFFFHPNWLPSKW